MVLSIVPLALTHLPWVIASGVAVATLEYLVLSSTVTGVWVVLPEGSVPATVMVLPATEATDPRTGLGFAGSGDGEPGGGVVLAPGRDLGCGQVPLTEGLTRTDAAVTGCPPWASWLVGCTVTQLPEVTSLSVAGVTSVTLVVEVKFTVALVLSSLVTWSELPATEAISPLTFASPWAGGAAVEVTVDVEVEVDVDVWLALFDEPQAAMDSAAAPVTATIAHRRTRMLADFKAFPQS